MASCAKVTTSCLPGARFLSSGLNAGEPDTATSSSTTAALRLLAMVTATVGPTAAFGCALTFCLAEGIGAAFCASAAVDANVSATAPAMAAAFSGLIIAPPWFGTAPYATNRAKVEAEGKAARRERNDGRPFIALRDSTRSRDDRGRRGYSAAVLTAGLFGWTVQSAGGLP